MEIEELKMKYRSLVAFREVYGDGFVSAGGPAAELEVPDDLVEKLIADGYIDRQPIDPQGIAR